MAFDLTTELARFFGDLQAGVKTLLPLPAASDLLLGGKVGTVLAGQGLGAPYTFSGQPSLLFGSSVTGLYVPSGLLNVNTTSASNVSTAETDLMTYALPTLALGATNKAVHLRAFGTTAANANSKVIKLYFGATALCSATTVVVSAVWMVEAIVIRTGLATQVAVGWANANNSGFNTFLTSSPAENLGTAITIKVTGTSAVATADITAVAMMTTALP